MPRPYTTPPPERGTRPHAVVKKIHRGGAKTAAQAKQILEYLQRTGESQDEPFVTLQRSAMYLRRPVFCPIVGRQGPRVDFKRIDDRRARDIREINEIARGLPDPTTQYAPEDQVRQQTTHIVASFPNIEELERNDTLDEMLRRVSDPEFLKGRKYPPELCNEEDDPSIRLDSQHPEIRENWEDFDALVGRPKDAGDDYAKLTYLISSEWAEDLFRSQDADGFDNLTAFHKDTDHFHMHVVVNRRSRDGNHWLKISHHNDFTRHRDELERAQDKAAPAQLNAIGMTELRERQATVALRYGVVLDTSSRAERGLDEISETAGEHGDRMRASQQAGRQMTIEEFWGEAGIASAARQETPEDQQLVDDRDDGDIADDEAPTVRRSANGTERRRIRRSERQRVANERREAAAKAAERRTRSRNAPGSLLTEAENAERQQRRAAEVARQRQRQRAEDEGRDETRRRVPGANPRKRKRVPLEQEFQQIEKRARAEATRGAASTHGMELRNARSREQGRVTRRKPQTRGNER